MPIGLNTTRFETERRSLLADAAACLRDMLKYHPCEHPHLDPCCCACESKLVLRRIEERGGAQTSAAGGMASATDFAIDKIEDVFEAARIQRKRRCLDHVGETVCEACDGEGEVDRDVENECGGYVARMYPCVACESTGKLLCEHCGEAPATYAYHWFREQPEYRGPAIDRICEACSKLPAYAGGAG